MSFLFNRYPFFLTRVTGKVKVTALYIRNLTESFRKKIGGSQNMGLELKTFKMIDIMI